MKPSFGKKKLKSVQREINTLGKHTENYLFKLKPEPDLSTNPPSDLPSEYEIRKIVQETNLVN